MSGPGLRIVMNQYRSSYGTAADPANKKGGTDRPRLFDALTDGSDYFDVLSLGAFLALGDFELHFLAFDQGFETRA